MFEWIRKAFVWAVCHERHLIPHHMPQRIWIKASAQTWFYFTASLPLRARSLSDCAPLLLYDSDHIQRDTKTWQIRLCYNKNILKTLFKQHFSKQSYIKGFRLLNQGQNVSRKWGRYKSFKSFQNKRKKWKSSRSPQAPRIRISVTTWQQTSCVF